MKKPPSRDPDQISITRLRAIEQNLGVFIQPPKPPLLRGTNQQFGIYDEDEEYVGNIIAAGTYFTALELERAIKKLFKVDE